MTDSNQTPSVLSMFDIGNGSGEKFLVNQSTQNSSSRLIRGSVFRKKNSNDTII